MHSQGLKFQALIFHPSSYLPGPTLLDTVKPSIADSHGTFTTIDLYTKDTSHGPK